MRKGRVYLVRVKLCGFTRQLYIQHVLTCPDFVYPDPRVSRLMACYTVPTRISIKQGTLYGVMELFLPD